jgi:Ca2+/Na+ antiporter
MKKPVDYRKHIEYDSRLKIILLTVFCFATAIAAFFLKDENTPFLILLSAIFFGLCGLFLLYRLLNPKTIFVKDEPERLEKMLEEERKQEQEDPGLFTYSNQGFVLKNEKQHIQCNWSDIETIFAYRKGMLGEEELMLDVFTTGKTLFTVGELVPGWFQFNKRLWKLFPFAPKEWEGEVLDPDLPAKRKLLYDKKQRTEQKAEADCYTS